MSPRKRDKPAREQAVAAAMVAEVKARGLALTGPVGLLKLFTKNVLEAALNEEMTEHLGHEKNRAEPDRESTNVRNGTVRRPWSRMLPVRSRSAFRVIGKVRLNRRS